MVRLPSSPQMVPLPPAGLKVRGQGDPGRASIRETFSRNAARLPHGSTLKFSLPGFQRTALRISPHARALLASTIVLGVGALLAVQGLETVRGAGRRLGFLPGPGALGVRVLSVAPGEPADRAGVHAGDEILAAAGRRLTSVADYEEAAAGFERGRPVALRIARGGRAFDTAAVPGAPPRWSPFLLNLLTAAGFLAMALLALAQGSGLRGSLLAAFSTAVALEIALPVDVVGRPLLGAAALSAYYLLTGLQIGIELHLTALIPERVRWLRGRPWIVPAWYAAG